MHRTLIALLSATLISACGTETVAPSDMGSVHDMANNPDLTQHARRCDQGCIHAVCEACVAGDVYCHSYLTDMGFCRLPDGAM